MNKKTFILFDKDAWVEVYTAIRKNKLRTILTMIGVAWGMFLFVTLLGAARGMQNGFDDVFADTATNSLFVWMDETTIPYQGYQRGRTLEFKMSDIEAIRQNFPEIKMMAPRNEENNVVATYKNKYNTYKVNGDYPEQIIMFGKDIIAGRFINAEDIQKQTKVCVIGKQVKDELFPKGANPLGQHIKMGNAYYTIVGVYELPSAPFESESEIYIPFTTFQKVYNKADVLRYAIVNLPDDYDIQSFEERLKSFLKQRKKVAPEDTQAIGGFNLGAALSQLFSFMNGMQLLAIVVGAMTLFSGVIAISSILLITVSERTKEFGIRRALGAVPTQIRSQILLESVVLTLIAGLTGIIMATILLAIINTFVIPNLEDFPFINASVDVTTLGIALLIMTSMAMLAGLIPAQRAISIKPIDALRDE